MVERLAFFEAILHIATIVARDVERGSSHCAVTILEDQHRPLSEHAKVTERVV